MTNQFGKCKDCGVSLIHDYGDLAKGVKSSISSIPCASAPINSVAKGSKSSYPNIVIIVLKPVKKIY